ncbi:MAG: metal ABC transporter permease [candidate division WOR-3 bacterium]
MKYSYFQNALIGSILAGLGLGIVGVWVILLRIPFVGVAISHAAFAGSVVGLLIGVDPIIMAIVFSLFASILIGPLVERSGLEANIIIGIVFSLVLGIAFFSLGLIKGPKTEAFNLIWGSILTLTKRDLIINSGITAFIILFLFLFNKEIKAVFYNREVAFSCGIPERFIFFSLLFLSGFVICLNLNTIGGILIFSLLINPPSSARILTHSLSKMYLLSILFCIFSCLCGLFLSFLIGVPASSAIIIFSSLIFLILLSLKGKK